MGTVAVLVGLSWAAAVGYIGVEEAKNREYPGSGLQMGGGPVQPFGSTQRTELGNTVTVHAVEYPAHPDPGIDVELDHGEAFAAVDVEVCATSAPIATVSTYDFYLDPYPDHQDPPIKEPALPDLTKPLPLGSCVRGWVSFKVGSHTESFYVLYANPPETSTPFRWG